MQYILSRVPSNVLTLPDFKKALQTGGTDRQTDRLTEHSFMTIDGGWGGYTDIAVYNYLYSEY